MHRSSPGPVRGLRVWILGSITLAVMLCVAAGVGMPTAEARAAVGRYVDVDGVSLERTADRAVVKARVQWNSVGVDTFRMNIGDLRLVAVSEHGHLPFVLATDSRDITGAQSREITFVITDAAALAAMHTGNRIVLTASQHQQPGQTTRSNRTYVTVAEVQRFGSPQAHIGTEDCSDTAIVPGAMLRYCDLVGADLDGALVSIHDPKSDEGRVPSKSTRLERADLTGVTAVRSDFSGASIAGGRINGIDLSRAKLDNLSLAGAQAREITARGATSDKDARDSGANMFRTNLSGADLRETVFRGISVARANLNGAQLQGAAWQSIADGSTFRGADLTGADLGASKTDYVDFTDAVLTGASLSDLQLGWTYLCRTVLPTGSALDRNRDCRTASEAPRVPIDAPDQDHPFVAVDDAAINDGSRPGERVVTGRISWDVDSASSSGYGMSNGTVRLVAIDAASGLPTILDSQTFSSVLTPANYSFTINQPDQLASITRGNRVVLTATQHSPRPRGGRLTTRTYVTVGVLQPGPGLGRIGRLDCSAVALSATSTRPLDFCDLSGAMLDYALLAGRFMREVDLTGATLQNGALSSVFLDASRLTGARASGATLTNVSAFDAVAPQLDLSGAGVVGSPLYFRNLDRATFAGSTLSDSPLVAASLRAATFSGARLIHPDLAYTDLSAAQLDGVNARLSNPTLFLANLTHANLTGSHWNVDEGGENPAQWATLCSTTLPDDLSPLDGDRDCPR